MAKVPGTTYKEPKDSGEFVFRFLGDIWHLLSKRDKRIMKNFWRGIVQVTGDLYTKAYEINLSNAIFDMATYNNTRWNKYEFNENTLMNLVPSPISGYSYVHTLNNSKIVSIPTIQDRIDRPNVVLKENVDYIVRYGLIYFNQDPSIWSISTDIYNRNTVFWAKNTFLNKETPYKNFGMLIDFYQTNSVQYLNILKGLWYAYWTGPTPRNIVVALYLLFGLPVALKAGTVSLLWAQSGKRYVTIKNTDNTESIYEIPLGLDYNVEEGDSVSLFDPLSTGVRVIDKMNTPGFVTSELGREGIQRYLLDEATRGTGDTDETKALDILEDSLWVPQIDAGVFNYAVSISDVRSFLNNIEPTYTDFILQFLLIIDDEDEEIIMDEEIESMDIDIDITQTVDANPVNDMNETTFNAYQTTGDENANLDSECFLFTEETSIEVRDSGGTLIDIFDAVL